MKVKSIVIDGFKSYAHRQELSNIDPHFNAIVGLNGSGKSNVFDAICFVMGLRNVAKVRVERQEELIFKNGKAGIQRASVTIEFDNSDPATAPEHYSPAEFPTISITRQIDTGLRQRFFFNGRLCDQDRIKEFFIHASLNIENPHFLVQQGQIHRLVGMKPADILGYIEEAAGTLVFDHSRRKAELQMRSKEKRLAEINESIDTGIGPRLQAIEEQGKELTRYEELRGVVDQLAKFAAAFEIYDCDLKARDARLKLDTVNGRLLELRQSVRDSERVLTERAAEVQSLEQQRDAPGQEVRKLTETQAELKKAVVRHKTQAQQTAKAAKTLAEQVAKNESDMEKAAADLARFANASNGGAERHEELEAEIEKLTTQIDELAQSIRLQRSGVNAGFGGRSLKEEAHALSRTRIETEGKIKTGKLQIQTLHRNIHELREEIGDASNATESRDQELKAAQHELQRAEAAFKPLEQAAQRLAFLKRAMSQQQQRVQTAQERVIRDCPIVAPLNYNVHAVPRDMEAALRGRVGELVRVRDAQRHSLALSVGCSSMLQRYVITRDDYAQLLLDSGKLATRTSFWALNKVDPVYQTAELRARMDAAYTIARNMASSFSEEEADHFSAAVSEDNNHRGPLGARCAIDLVEFDPEYQPMMERVFGGFFVCSSIEIAKAIAYDPRCRFRAVTLDGDSVDPSGLMQGGSRGAVQDMLGEYARGARKVAEYKAVQRDHMEFLAELRQLREQESQVHTAQELVDTAKQRVDELLASADEDGENGGGGVARHKKQLAEMEEKLRRTRHDVEEVWPRELARVTERSEQIEKSKDMDTGALLKQLENEQEKSRKRLVELQKAQAAGRAEFEKNAKQREKLLSAKEINEQALADRRADLAAARDDEAKAADELRNVEQQTSNTAAALKEVKAKYDDICERYARAVREVEATTEDLADTKRTIDRTTTEQNDAEKVARDAGARLEAAERHKPAWITPELRASLGDAAGPYYFSDQQRTKETLDKLKSAQEAASALKKKVHPNARAMLDRYSEEHRKLTEQRETLMEDKESIVQSISGVEKHKWAALDDVVARVSEHFSALFHTCLDYATCRLAEQRDSATGRLMGLEVKVAFNGKEKASLTELSGGQRSLLALCLILSILRVHRAPVYILDEVDAALDPSHTQNLGIMLKRHFADSQFLLVSLKDGMFSNANVVYEVRNTQGFSEISRKEFKRGK